MQIRRWSVAVACGVGAASSFTETPHPEEGAKQSLVIVNASGTLDDGRSFSLHVTLNDAGAVRRVRVTFGG